VRVTLLHNPGSGDTALTAGDLEAMLSEAGYQVRYQSSRKKWPKALKDPGDLVVVAGGDGTVAKAAVQLAGTGVPLAVLPVGTANNVAKTFRIVGDAREIIAGWKHAPRQPFDVGIASGPRGEARFIESVGGGIFATLILQGEEEVEDSRSIVGRETDRAVHRLRQLVRNAEPRPWEIRLDDRDLSGSYIGVEAMNIRFAGPNVPLAREADPGDGLLDVVLIGEGERDALAGYLTERLEHGASSFPDLPVERGKLLHLAPPAGAPLHVDDGPWLEDEGSSRPAGAIGEGPGAVDIFLKQGAVQVLLGV
jgi:diacylglycerol kinase (ATP)